MCGQCWKPSFIGSDLEVITIHDFFLNEAIGQCEEGRRCFNVKCKFNKTTPESYVANKGWSDKGLKLLKKTWKNTIEGLAAFQPMADECKKAYSKDSKVGAVEFGEEKR
jgi:hypothetical protein